LPEEHRCKFDIVVNSGTTEHVMNQYNAFGVIHDATAVGGEILHILPVTGHTDHGYVQYTSRFFFDLAGYNGYEIVHVSFDAGGSSMLFDPLRRYSGAFPMLNDVITKGIRVAADRWQPEYAVRDTGIRIKYRKLADKKFVGALDPATAVADLAQDVVAQYQSSISQGAKEDKSRWSGFLRYFKEHGLKIVRLIKGT
jgi:hypothetical protein